MIVKAKIGAVEFSGDEVRVAVVKTGRRLPQVVELQARPIAYDGPEQRFEAMTRALDQALDALETRPATYVLCVPSKLTIVRSLTIPFKGQARVAKAVPFEIEPHLAFPLEDLLLDYSVVAERGGMTEVVAVGVRRKHLEEQLAVLDAAGVEPEMAAVDAGGMTALWQATQRNVKGLRAVWHIRERDSVICVLHNNAMAFFRHLYFGAAQIVSDPQPAAREVQNTLRAFLAKWQGDEGVDVLSVTGLDAVSEEMEVLEEALGLPIVRSPILSKLKGAEQALASAAGGGEFNRWEAVVGAAYSAGGGGLAFNMMKDAQQIQGVVRGVVAHLMFSACLALLFILGCAWYYHEGRLRNEAVIALIREEIAALGTEIDAMAAEGLGEDIEYAIFGDPPVLDLLTEIAERMPENKVSISEIRISPPGGRQGWIDITGSTPNAADFNAAFEELKKVTMFKLADETNIRLQGERTTFRVRAFRLEEDINEDQS